MRQQLALVTLLAATGISQAAPPPDDLVDKMAGAIRKHCPGAIIETTDGAFTAKSGTMTFTVHARSKTGEIFPRTYQEEGPNVTGFMLRVSLNDGPYAGAAVAPQTVRGPYYPTDFSAPAVGNKHYLVHFSYGSRLDPALAKAVRDTLPK